MQINIDYTTEEISQEKWQSIPYYEGIYEASSLGRIRTCQNKTTYTQRHGARHWKQRILKIKYCKAIKSPNRYDGRVELWKEGVHKTHLVARLVISSFNKTYDLFDKKITVNHIDGNSLNNRISNLEWCTRKENIQKGFRQGLYSGCKKVKVINKKTGEETIHYSLEDAGKFMGFKHGYLSTKICREKNNENSNFYWEII